MKKAVITHINVKLIPFFTIRLAKIQKLNKTQCC